MLRAISSLFVCGCLAGEGVLELQGADFSATLNASGLQALLNNHHEDPTIYGTTTVLPPLGPCAEGNPQCAYAEATWERLLQIPHRELFEITIGTKGGWFGPGALTFDIIVRYSGDMYVNTKSQVGDRVVLAVRTTCDNLSSGPSFVEILVPHRYGQTHSASLRALNQLTMPTTAMFVNAGQDLPNLGHVETEHYFPTNSHEERLDSLEGTLAAKFPVASSIATAVEFEKFFSSATEHSIATVTGSNVGLQVMAKMDYITLYAYAGHYSCGGSMIATTRRANNAADWVQNIIGDSPSGQMFHCADTAAQFTIPNFRWENGVLLLTTAGSVQVTASIKITHHATDTLVVH